MPIPLLVRDPRFREHAGGLGHPERPERLDAVDQALAPIEDLFRAVEPRPATDDEILLAHSADHLGVLKALEGRAAQIDPETYSAPRSLEIARLAIGSLIDVSLCVARGGAPSAFAAIRPPGHHAEPERSMGFCLLNNVAIAAQALRMHAGLEKICIVDFDVHHGNGTQARFEAERDVLFISTHQYPFYPGTGALDETGRDAGLGTTVNLPLPAGCGDAEYGPVFDEVIVPILLEFDPDLILVSAGFDGHARDPLASMNLSTHAFGVMAARLRAVAEETCGGRLVMTLEGGYDLEALGASVAEVLGVLAAPEVAPLEFPTSSPGGIEWSRRFREAHVRRWSCLRSAGVG